MYIYIQTHTHIYTTMYTMSQRVRHNLATEQQQQQMYKMES